MEEGQVKCPKCGATDISTNTKTGMLRCNFCRFEFADSSVNEDKEEDIFSLEGLQISAGLKDRDKSADTQITLRCESCGAQVVVDTQEASQARCHWCRNMLSINHQIDNGTIPDMVLPFNMPKKEAKDLINGYIAQHKFFAHPTFLKEFSAENVMGVYFPYMIVDANTSVNFEGTGEVEVRRYTVGSGDNKETRYDADLYALGRSFDMGVNDLTVESSSKRMDNTESETNNIINAILPFDTENCVAYDSNYLKGYTSEKRDTDVKDIKQIVETQIKDIARVAANEQAEEYDRGICWDKEEVTIKGTKWKSAYLPVWLYSYQQKKDNKSILHYVALNARTKELVGSIPINKIRLFIISAIIELLSILTFGGVQALEWSDSDSDHDVGDFALIMLAGFLFYAFQYARYRRMGDRHFFERETKKIIKNATGFDKLLEHRKNLENSEYSKANNDRVEGVILERKKPTKVEEIAEEMQATEVTENITGEK